MVDLDAALLATLLRESLQKGQHPRLTITSNSMTPLLHQGDEILLESITLGQLQPGDILTITTETYLQTHRYFGQKQQAGTPYLLTRGDQPLTFDTPWAMASVIGRVMARQRHSKMLFLHHGWGKWLNTQLSGLATAESHWYAIIPEQPAPILTPYQRRKRYLFWFAAKLLTNFVDSLN
jgi:signal peptidase I